MGIFYVISVVIFFMFVSAPADAWPSQKKYDAYIASLPAEGESPAPEYVQRSALSYFKYNLKDPDSAKYEWGPIERGTWKGAYEKWGTPGWIATVQVNSKNSYGAYVGYTPYKFIFRSGSIVEIYRYNSRLQGWEYTIGIDGKIIPPLQ